MGDRVYVNFICLRSQAEEAEALFDETPEESYDDYAPLLTWFGFVEINYGDLGFLEELQKAGIAYDSSWEGAGGSFGPGTASCRFTPTGEKVRKIIYDSDRDPPITELLSRLNNYEDLKDYILTYKNRYAVLPWDNQEEYGKHYRTLQLITPK